MKRILAGFISVLMIFTGLPLDAFAAQAENVVIQNETTVEQQAIQDTENGPEVLLAEETYEHIQLKVPYFPQKVENDCGIPAIAMIEAYANGRDKTSFDEMYAAVKKANNNSLKIYTACTNGKYRDIEINDEIFYQELKAGNPILIRREPYDHWSVIVGYNGSTTKLERSGFIVWDTKRFSNPYEKVANYDEVVTGKKFDLARWLKAPEWRDNLGYYVDRGQTELTVARVRDKGIVNGSTEDLSTYQVTNTGVTSITGTTAKINAKLSPGARVSELGFYLGTSPGNMEKKVEDDSTYVESIWYNLGTGKWTSALQPGTTYYYKIYVIIDGKTYETSVDSFTTKKDDSSGRVVNSGVTSITETTARINAKLSPGAKVSEVGFYWGTSPENMQKKVESTATYVESIWYDLGTGKWTSALQPGTTYYYQIYAIINGVTHTSTIDSFTTDAKYFNLYLNPNGGVFSDGTSDVVTANPQLIYGGGNWWNISGFPVSRSGYILNGWYNAASGGTKVYNADGTACNEGNFWKDNVLVYSGDIGVYAQWTDATKPVITDVRIGELSSEGYTVYCEVTDNEGIERVCFPTWTDVNGQDDLKEDWYNNEKATGVSGSTYSFRVNISEHNGERGGYTTHIYAYDLAGNHEFAGTVAVVPKYVPFPDVKIGSWYYNSIADVYEKGYMSGRGDGSFGPDIKLTRAEIATVIYNMEKKPSVAYANKFLDVADGQWYSKPISWAYRNDIASGYGNGKFGVGDNITREQMAQMLYAYARMKGYDISYTEGKINQYGDSKKVSNWAKPAMNWAITKGIMSGKGSGDDLSKYKLDPTGNTTRAECAAMLKNFMDAYGM